ncbi:hypothetical protein WJX74_002725 [Apatococcus lobatus]|uniref:Uncharacterized protein n=1 Tax=Apatococcus lobatus TaxID=904363 RepID=A0AAW1QMB9_9CHLO
MAATGVFEDEGSQPSISNYLNGTLDQNRGLHGGHDNWQLLGPENVDEALQPVRSQSDDEFPEHYLPGLPTPAPTRRRRIRIDHIDQYAYHSPAHEGTCLHGNSAAHQVTLVWVRQCCRAVVLRMDYRLPDQSRAQQDMWLLAPTARMSSALPSQYLLVSFTDMRSFLLLRI